MSNTKRKKVEQGEEGLNALALVEIEADAPSAGRPLNEKQAKFVYCLTSGGETGGDVAKSAAAAGYAKKHAGEIGRQLLEKPHVLAAVDIALREAIGARLTIKAVRTIERILDSTTATEKLKGEMAVRVIEFSGLADRTKHQKTNETGLGGKTLAECSRAQLEDIVRKGAAVLQAAAALPPAGQTIEGTLSAPNNAQPLAEAAE